MKGIKLTALAVLAAFALLVSPITAVAADAAADSGPIRKMSVTGTGTVKVKPDIAFVSLGVQTTLPDAGEAQTQNAAVITAVIDAVKALGIAEADIETAGYSIYPQYDYESGNGQAIIGYNVNNSVNVTVRDIKQISAVIDGGVKAGANISNGIKFGISDPVKYYDMAAKQALEDAKHKAENIAAVLGITLDLPIEISEQNMDYYPSRNSSVTARAEAATDMATPIQAGDLEVTATLYVVYAY